MLKFKRVLHQGMRGRDVSAVKIALGHAGFGPGYVHLHSRRFGPSMRTNLKKFQRHKAIKADGVYGPKTHTALTPHFSRYARWLYSRQRVAPPVPASVRAAAQRLVELHADGKFHDDRGTVFPQIERASRGLPVYNAFGRAVYLDAKMLEALVWLIDAKGHRIGLFALCSDHPFDGNLGHAGGHAADVSSIDGVGVLSGSAKPHVIKLMDDLRGGPHRPWQLISGGYAARADTDCRNRCIPSAWFYGLTTLSQHENHVHVGY